MTGPSHTVTHNRGKASSAPAAIVHWQLMKARMTVQPESKIVSFTVSDVFRSSNIKRYGTAL